MAIVVPSIFAEATNSAMDHAIRIGKVAFDATDLVPDIKLLTKFSIDLISLK